MAKEQLLLPAPYGYAKGFHISLTAADGFDEETTVGVVCMFGCPPRIARKAVSCLKHSGRYDCVMSPQAWGDGLDRNLRAKLAGAGVQLILLSKPNPSDPGLRIRDIRDRRDGSIKRVHDEYEASELERRRLAALVQQSSNDRVKALFHDLGLY